MACNPEVLKQVPLFALLDEEELAVLAGSLFDPISGTRI
jgi:hypothetical protein